MSEIVIATVRGIKRDGKVEEIVSTEEYAESPDIDTLVEEKPSKKGGKKNKPEVVEVQEEIVVEQAEAKDDTEPFGE